MNDIEIARELTNKLLDLLQVVFKRAEEADIRILDIDHKSRVIAKELAEKEQALKEDEKRLIGEREWVRRERMQLQSRELSVKKLEEDTQAKVKDSTRQEENLKELEKQVFLKKQDLEEFNRKQKELELQQGEIQKQIALDRKRKEILRIKEERVDLEKQRLQRLSEV